MNELNEEFIKILNQYDRVALTGGTKTGKSTLSLLCTDRPVFHTDDKIDIAWKDIPEAVIGEVSKLGKRFLVEGCQLPRAIRKGLQVDAVIWMSVPHIELTPKQTSFSVGIRTTFEGLDLRKIKVFYL